MKYLFRFKWHCIARWLQFGATRTWPAISPQSIRGAASEWSLGNKIDAAAITCLSCVVVVFSLIALLSADFHAVTCRYKRIFSIGTKGITTYNPSNLEVTNQVRMCRSISCYMWLSCTCVHSCNRSNDVIFLYEVLQLRFVIVSLAPLMIASTKWFLYQFTTTFNAKWKLKNLTWVKF